MATWQARDDANRPPDRRPARWVARHPDEPAALAGMVEWGPHRWSADGSNLELRLWVDPGHRRRGLGARLLDEALDAFRSGPALALETSTTEDRPDAATLLERRGFRLMRRMQASELDLSRIDGAALSTLARRLDGSGLVLRTLGEGRAGDLALLRLIHAFFARTGRDAPGMSDATLEPFDRWLLAYRGNPDLLPEAHVVALDGAAVVGMTQLWASQATDALLYTGFTGVARSYRRRGIATAMKARSLAWASRLRTAAGAAPRVRTGNEESNPMLGINLRLGFVPRPAFLILALARS